MRILVVQESDWIERGPHQQHHLMERLRRRGHEIRVIDYEITWKSKAKRPVVSPRAVLEAKGKTVESTGIQVIRPSMIRVPLLDYTSIPFSHGIEIHRQLRDFNPDIVLGLGIINTYIAVRLCKRYRKPFVYYLIDVLHTLIPEKELRVLGKALESRVIRSADLVFVINRKLRDYVISMGRSKENTLILGAGVDISRLNPEIDGAEIRRKYGVESEEIVLFFMGWLYSFSGVKEVARSLLNYNGTTRFRFMVVGRGDIYDELNEMKKNGLGDRLILVNWQPYSEVPKYIAASDICLVPAYDNEVMRDIVPIKIYEYMACGKPVIATKLRGIFREFGEENGIVYVDRPEDVLKKAVDLAQNVEVIKQIGMKSTKYVQKYSWENLTDQFEETLKALVEHYPK